MERQQKLWMGGTALAVALTAGGTGIALASGVGDGESLDGTIREQVERAALEHTGGGTVLESEQGDGGAAYEVEVRRPDGSVVEIQLDEQLAVIDTAPDDDTRETGDDSDETDGTEDDVSRSHGRAAAIRYEIARLRFEVNSTARDGGVQMLLDGEGWTVSRIFHPDGGLLLRVTADGQVADVGVTELFFESAEPSFDDLSFQALLAKFPEGVYRVTGTSADGTPMVARARLSHDVPRGPRIVSPAPGAETGQFGTVVDWRPVTKQYRSDATVDIRGYQVIVEREEPFRSFQVDLPAWVTRVKVPAAFLQPGTDYKFEVLAIAQGNNQTITEGEFSTR